MIKRMLSVVMVLALLIVACACSFAEDGSDEPITISIAIPLNTNVLDYATNTYTLALEEAFNIKLDIMPLENIYEKLPIMVTSGSKLPDMICAELDSNTVWNWAQKGILVPLTEYWNDPDMTKELYQYVDEMGADPALIKLMLSDVTMPDGQIYTLPAYDENYWNLNVDRLRVNTAWFEASGFDIPTTLDDFRELLRYFRDNDLNGNGDATDEIPFTGNVGLNNPAVYIMNAFIHANPRSNYINVEDGKIVPAYTQDAFRDALEYIRDMYAEGLIDPLAFTQDHTQLKGIVTQDPLIVASYISFSDNTATNAETKKAYTIFGPVTGPDGVCFAPTIPASTTGKVYVTRDAKYPELCFKIAEVHYGREWRHIFRLGTKGVNWSDDPELIRQYKLNFVSGNYDLVSFVNLENVWGTVNNVIWNDEDMPFFSIQEGIINQVTGQLVADLTEEELNTPSTNEMHYTLYYPYRPAEMPGTLIYTTEEMDSLAYLSSAINNYAEEMIMAFIAGTESLDNWDAFQAELQKMGLEEYVAIMQAAYDRKMG